MISTFGYFNALFYNSKPLTNVYALQGIPFFHAGEELLRSKSLDCDSYNSGDWFNRCDFKCDILLAFCWALKPLFSENIVLIFGDFGAIAGWISHTSQTTGAWVFLPRKRMATSGLCKHLGLRVYSCRYWWRLRFDFHDICYWNIVSFHVAACVSCWETHLLSPTRSISLRPRRTF